MDADIKLNEIALEALNTFPSLGEDNSAASNYAQRVLTKILAQKRKDGQNITDDTAQALRERLNCVVSTIELPSTPTAKAALETSSDAEIEGPRADILDAIISDCFHTSTDGSSEHLKHLHNKARAAVASYLDTTNAGFIAKFNFKNYAKKKIQYQLDALQNDKA